MRQPTSLAPGSVPEDQVQRLARELALHGASDSVSAQVCGWILDLGSFQPMGVNQLPSESNFFNTSV